MNGVEQVGLIALVIAPQTFGSNRRHTKALLDGMDITILDDSSWRRCRYIGAAYIYVDVVLAVELADEQELFVCAVNTILINRAIIFGVKHRI